MRRSIHSEAYSAFVDLMIEARKASGMTQAEVAMALGKPQSFVSKYERRERRLDVVEFVTIARILRTDPIKMLKVIDGLQTKDG